MTIVFSGGNSRSSTGDNNIIVSYDNNSSRPQIAQDELKLAGRDLIALPDYVCKNPQLKILDASNNLLGHADDNVLSQLCGLKNLTRLNLSANELKILPLNANSFPLLEVLCVSGNELEYLSDGVTGLLRYDNVSLNIIRFFFYYYYQSLWQYNRKCIYFKHIFVFTCECLICI